MVTIHVEHHGEEDLCSEIGIVSDVFFYNFKDTKLMKQKIKIEGKKKDGSKIVRSAAFIQRKPILYQDNYYLLEYGRRCGIYVYSCKEKKFLDNIKGTAMLGKDNWKAKIKVA